MAAQSQKSFRRWYTRLVLVSMVWLSSWLLRGLFLTLRPIYVQRHFEHRVKDSGQPALLAIWHGRLLYFVHLYRHMAATVLVSRSKDGAAHKLDFFSPYVQFMCSATSSIG